MEKLFNTEIKLNGLDYRIAAIDVGNSRLKVHHDDVYIPLVYDREWKRALLLHFRDETQHRYLIGVASVNPRQTKAVIRVVQRCPGHMVLNMHILMMRNEKLLSFGRVENAGMDRLMGILGALQLVKPPLITIDCGTAVTVNAVSKNRVFQGGRIFAGLGTQLVGLHRSTSSIPEMNYEAAEGNVGINTHEAVMSGILGSVTGGILDSLAAFRKGLFKDKDVPVIVTGGESGVIGQALIAAGIKIKQDPHLVTRGILSLIAESRADDLQDSVMSKVT